MQRYSRHFFEDLSSGTLANRYGFTFFASRLLIGFQLASMNRASSPAISPSRFRLTGSVIASQHLVQRAPSMMQPIILEPILISKAAQER